VGVMAVHVAPLSVLRKKLKFCCEAMTVDRFATSLALKAPSAARICDHCCGPVNSTVPLSCVPPTICERSPEIPGSNWVIARSALRPTMNSVRGVHRRVFTPPSLPVHRSPSESWASAWKSEWIADATCVKLHPPPPIGLL
jgi:hypothetical protein